MSVPFAEVIGDPIAHSKSPLIHNFWLEALGIPGDYRRFHVTADALPDYIAGACADADWRGCNVTLPHKVAVMDLVDDPGDVRGTIGAMNTIVRQPDGAVIGTNTDAAGFYAPLADLDLEGAPVAVVGAGGAARAVLFALARADVGHVTIFNRSPLKAMGLLATFGLKGEVVALDAPLPPAALLVNSSSLGMKGQPPLEIELSALRPGTIVDDIVYVPLRTALLDEAERRGGLAVDGLGMLLHQAVRGFELWFGRRPAVTPELRALVEADLTRAAV